MHKKKQIIEKYYDFGEKCTLLGKEKQPVITQTINDIFALLSGQ